MGLCFVFYAHAVDISIGSCSLEAADTAARAIYRQPTEEISVTTRHVEKRPRKTTSGHRHQELCISKELRMFEAVYVREYSLVTIHENLPATDMVLRCFSAEGIGEKVL